MLLETRLIVVDRLLAYDEHWPRGDCGRLLIGKEVGFRIQNVVP
jgi:hypothetical protein